jgi:hypothetical protein
MQTNQQDNPVRSESAFFARLACEARAIDHAKPRDDLDWMIEGWGLELAREEAAKRNKRSR